VSASGLVLAKASVKEKVKVLAREWESAKGLVWASG
jgi:hypothetical protein